MSKAWRFVTPALWLLALALAVWTLRQLPYLDMLSRLGSLSARDWVPWLLINALILYLAVKRWLVLSMALDAPLSMRTLFRVRQAGSAVSFLTPGPQFGGEPLQLYWLSRIHQLPLHQAVASLGLDRFLESASNLSVLLAGVLMLVGTTIMPFAEWLQVVGILSVLLVLLVLGGRLLIRHPAWLAQRFSAATRRWQNSARADSLQQGWTALRALLQQTLATRQPSLWLALLLTLAGWVALLLELVFLLHVLELSPGLLDVVLIVVGIRLAMLLPMPGGIGTIEASLLWSFGYLGLPLSAAAGLIALNRLRDALVLLINLGCLASYRGQRNPNPPSSAG